MSRQPWSTNPKNRRKFLRSPGRYVAPDGSPAEAPLAFWAEWEAPSYVVQRWPEEDALPRFLQEPRWERPTIKGFRQNTDPWVFGDCFRYSNCHQLNQNGLRNLASGLPERAAILHRAEQRVVKASDSIAATRRCGMSAAREKSQCQQDGSASDFARRCLQRTPLAHGLISRAFSSMTFASAGPASGAGALHHDLNAAVLRPAVRRIVRGDGMRVAEPLGGDDVRVDALRLEIRDDVIGAARGQVDVVGNPRPLQGGPTCRLSV